MTPLPRSCCVNGIIFSCSVEVLCTEFKNCWLVDAVYYYYFCSLCNLVVYLGVSMEMNREAESNDITECSNDDKPCIGKLCLLFRIE